MATELFDYTEKSIIVLGDTRPKRQVFTAIGGKFNSYLTHPKRGVKVSGWVLHKKHTEAVKEALDN